MRVFWGGLFAPVALEFAWAMDLLCLEPSPHVPVDLLRPLALCAELAQCKHLRSDNNFDLEFDSHHE